MKSQSYLLLHSFHINFIAANTDELQTVHKMTRKILLPSDTKCNALIQCHYKTKLEREQTKRKYCPVSISTAWFVWRFRGFARLSFRQQKHSDEYEWQWMPETHVKGEAVPLQACIGPEVSRKLRQSADEGGKFVSRKHRPPLPPGSIPGTHFCWKLSRSQDHIAAGRICQWKTPMTPLGIEPATFRIVACVPENPSTGRKTQSQCHFTPQIPYGLVLDRARPSKVRGRQLLLP